MRKSIVVSLLAASCATLAVLGGRGFPALAQGSGGSALENGDCNGDGTRDLSDAAHLLSWLFQGGPEPVSPLCPAPVYSDLIYDEFTSLMNKQFLLSPERYVPTVSERLSRQDYNSRQKGIFVSSEENDGWGIAIVHTNRNTWGKLRFTWGAPFSGGQPSLLIKDATLFGRVMDGHAPRTLPLLTVPSSYTVDLDTGTLGAGTSSDVWFHNIDGITMYIEAVNGASLEFPMQSLCR